MQVSKNFVLQEFIDPDTYKKWGDKSIWFIDPKVIHIAQLLRDKSGRAVTINNWSVGGLYKLSGLRPLDATIGAKLSQHKFGRAIDVKIQGYNPEQVHDLIKNNWLEFKEIGLTTLEDLSLTKTWTHIDVRNTGKDDLLIVGL